MNDYNNEHVKQTPKTSVFQMQRTLFVKEQN